MPFSGNAHRGRRDGAARRRRARAPRRDPRRRLAAHAPGRAARPRSQARARRPRRRWRCSSASPSTSRRGPSFRPTSSASSSAPMGCYIPPPLLARSLWLNVHPSLLPRWRGAAPVERAILAGDRETGVTIHETVEALDAGPIAAQEAFPVGDLDAGGVFERSAQLAARLLEEVLEAPSFIPQSEDGAVYAEKIGPADRELNLDDPLDAWRRVRALSPHIGAWTMLHGRRVTIWRARLRRRRLPARAGAAGRARQDELRRVSARCAVIAPARAAAYEVVRRVFEEEAYADRALAVSRRRPRRARPRARAAARLRHRPDEATARLRDRAARRAAGAQARSAGARGAAARRVPACVHRSGRARRRRRHGRARARRAARAGGAVHERRHAQACARSSGGSSPRFRKAR